MKKLTLILLIGFIANAAYSQQTFSVNEVFQYMSKGQTTGIEVLLSGSSIEDAQNSFEKFIKQYKGKFTSATKKNPEIFVDNAIIKTVSPNAVDLYATALPSDFGTKMTVYVDLGGAFVSSKNQPQSFTAMETILKEFARQEAIRLSDIQVDAEQGILDDYNDELKKLASEKAGYISEIEKSKALIPKREADIATINQKTIIQQQQIDLQNAKVQNATPEQVKAEEKILKGLQKELDNLLGDKDHYAQEIEKAKALIPKREADIVTNDQNQAIKMQQIQIQKNIVQIVTDKRTSLGK